MSRSALLSAAMAATLLAACKPADTRTENAATPPPPPQPNVVTVTALDYSYTGPDTIPAGLTTFRMANGGKEPHQMQLIRLDSSKTAQDMMALPPGSPAPAWEVLVGGPNAAVPGDTANATLDLEPGKYVMLCFIPGEDGKPHVMKGMMRPLEVIPGSGVAAAAPVADLSIVLSDYAFAISGPVSAGHHVIKVQNTATQPHELVLVQLAPGKKAADFTAWAMSMKGPPPGRPLSGMGAINPGQTAFMTDDLPAGNYALVCFFPDAGNGKSHVELGMVHELTVS